MLWNFDMRGATLDRISKSIWSILSYNCHRFNHRISFWLVVKFNQRWTPQFWASKSLPEPTAFSAIVTDAVEWTLVLPFVQPTTCSVSMSCDEPIATQTAFAKPLTRRIESEELRGGSAFVIVTSSGASATVASAVASTAVLHNQQRRASTETGTSTATAAPAIVEKIRRPLSFGPSDTDIDLAAPLPDPSDEVGFCYT